MAREIKFNIGDLVWFAFDGSPICGRIHRIRDFIYVRAKINEKMYLFTLKKERLYSDKGELLKMLSYDGQYTKAGT